MLSPRHLTSIVAIALLSACARRVSPQVGAPRLSVDGGVGAGTGYGGGERVDRSLVAAELLVTRRLARAPRKGFLIGFEGSRYLQISGDLVCLTRIPEAGCIPQYPAFDALNVLGGQQWQWTRALRVRVLAGPGYYTAYFKPTTTTSHSLGVGARADLAVHLFELVSATVAERGAWVPRIRGQSYVPTSTLIGLRVEMGW